MVKSKQKYERKLRKKKEKRKRKKRKMSRKQTNEPTLVICYAPSRHLAIASLQSFKALSQSELFKWHCARLLYNTAGKTHLEGKKKKKR